MICCHRLAKVAVCTTPEESDDFPVWASLFFFCGTFVSRCFILGIAKYHLHLDYIHKDLLAASLTEQGVSDEDSFGDYFGFCLRVANWAGEKAKCQLCSNHIFI